MPFVFTTPFRLRGVGGGGGVREREGDGGRRRTHVRGNSELRTLSLKDGDFRAKANSYNLSLLSYIDSTHKDN